MKIMRVILRFLVCLLPIVALSIVGSLEVVKRLQHQWLSSDLDRRSILIEQSIHDQVIGTLIHGNSDIFLKLLNRISEDGLISGVVLCDANGQVIATNDSVPGGASCNPVGNQNDLKSNLRSDATSPKKTAKIGWWDSNSVYRSILPITEAGHDLGQLIIYHDTSYMIRRHDTVRFYVITVLCGLFVFSFGVTLLVYQWSIGSAIRRLGGILKDMISGNIHPLDKVVAHSEFSVLAPDLSKVIRELKNAKEAVKDAESTLMWTPSRLRSEVQRCFGNSQLCVVANREPYVHNRTGGRIEMMLPASGLVSAVEPLVRACSGLWIAQASGTADRETADSSGKLLVPPGEPEYVLKRVWLTKTEEEGYYYGFSNEGIWPLCHIAHTRPFFDAEDWKQYQIVNERFAQKFAEEKWESNPIVMIQDYHFALLPTMIRQRCADATLSLFWHIPWPNPEVFGICPWKKEILMGMLGADLIGFHTQFHCNNFLDTVDRNLEARVDREQFSVTIQGHTCYVKPFAISVEWPSRHDIPIDAMASERIELLSDLNLPPGTRLGIGVDRVDYIKGIVERLRSIERFLEKYPEWIGKFSFIQIGAPSRTHIKRYQDLNSEVQELADRINWKFSQAQVPPIILKLAQHNAPEVFRYYRAAEVCFVTSLHDGMNLVAKEYVSAKQDNSGVLVLSTFAGASTELTDAILVNPYDIDECANALNQALTLSPAEAQEKMARLRAIVSEKNIYAWGGSFLNEIQRIAQLKGNRP